MNALREDARGRTKEDIAVIRHVYLDFDNNGTAAVQDIFKRRDLPTPSYVVNTSPGKWQVSWRVEGFAKDEAEDLQRALARETGADRPLPIALACCGFPAFITTSTTVPIWFVSSRIPPLQA